MINDKYRYNSDYQSHLFPICNFRFQEYVSPFSKNIYNELKSKIDQRKILQNELKSLIAEERDMVKASSVYQYAYVIQQALIIRKARFHLNMEITIIGRKYTGADRISYLVCRST